MKGECFALLSGFQKLIWSIYDNGMWEIDYEWLLGIRIEWLESRSNWKIWNG